VSSKLAKKLGNDWVINHVGMTVSDRNSTLRHYQAMGVGVSVGPQPLLPHEEGEGSLMFYRTLEGDPVTRTYQTGGAHHFTDGECQIGDCQLECYPMRPGPGIFLSEYLAKKGSGINHICFNSPAVEEDTQRLVGKGCDVMFNASVNGRTVENYLDTRRFGDLMISLRPPAGNWEKAWKKNNEAHPLVNDWQFFGVGIAVSCVSEAVDYYESLGFVREDGIFDERHFELRRQSVKVGPMTFDFVEPLADDSICAEVLRNRGEGVFSIIFQVGDLEAEKQRLHKCGLTTHANGIGEGCAYFDARSEGNVLVQLTQS